MDSRLEQQYIATLRTKSLRISELKVELGTIRTFLQAFAADTDNKKFCPTGFLSTVEQMLAHADKVIDGSDDQPDNVTPIRGDHDGND